MNTPATELDVYQMLCVVITANAFFAFGMWRVGALFWYHHKGEKISPGEWIVSGIIIMATIGAPVLLVLFNT